jgi:hypothetical protein
MLAGGRLTADTGLDYLPCVALSLLQDIGMKRALRSGAQLFSCMQACENIICRPVRWLPEYYLQAREMATRILFAGP